MGKRLPLHLPLRSHTAFNHNVLLQHFLSVVSRRGIFEGQGMEDLQELKANLQVWRKAVGSLERILEALRDDVAHLRTHLDWLRQSVEFLHSTLADIHDLSSCERPCFLCTRFSGTAGRPASPERQGRDAVQRTQQSDEPVRERGGADRELEGPESGCPSGQ